MGLGGILILLLLLVSLIVFIYIIVLTARGWGALHTTLLCFLFIECWVFMVFSAGVHGTRVKFTQEAAKEKENVEREETATQQLLWGDFNVLNLDAVIPAKNELRRLTSDRGRVWRGVNLVQTIDDKFELELSAAPQADDLAIDPAAAAADTAPTSESLPVDLVVYAFAEELNAEERPIPVFYLGEHTVTKSQAGAVTLEPTLALSKEQTDYLNDGGGSSWTLYELLPLDSHAAFAAPGSQGTAEEIFGRMDEATISDLLANIPAEDGRQQRAIDSYLRDGQRATPDDPADSIWVQLEMLKNYSFDVDSEEVANATERGYFDSNGRAIDERLKRSGEGESGTVELKENSNDLIVMKEEAAQQLEASGVAQSAQRIYVRPLNDYEQAFNNLSLRLHDVQERIDIFKRETALLNESHQKGQELISFEQVENQKLSSDVNNYRREMTVLNNALAEANDELASLKSQLNLMYRGIQSASYSNR